MPEVTLRDAKRFITECLISAGGAPREEAEKQADMLIFADTVGQFDYGMNRLELHLNEIKTGVCNAKAKPKIQKKNGSFIYVQGCQAMGATVGHFCMDLAIQKAKESGMGVVRVTGCSNFGLDGYWALQAEKEGFIGMTSTKSAPHTKDKSSGNGTHSGAPSAPVADRDSIVVDTVDTEKAQDSATLPPGGSEDAGGYKEFLASAAIDIMFSVLSDARASDRVPQWALDQSDLEQSFTVINPGRFDPAFGEDLKHCMDHWRHMEPAHSAEPVIASGDKEKASADDTEKRGTIIYSQELIDSCAQLAKKFEVEPLKVVQ